MQIKKVQITNFKSIYGTKTIDFSDLKGLIKLSGVVGSGKTTLGEAMLWGLYGTVKGQNNPALISWHCKEMEVTIEMISRNKEIKIIRNNKHPLEVFIDGKLLVASNKKDTQAILETEFYDVPKLAIEKMCIISFNAFKSIANMNPADTKTFLDDIFGFKTFTEYNDVIVDERKSQNQELSKFETLYAETENQIKYLISSKQQRQQEVAQTIDIDKVVSNINDITQKMSDITNEVKSYKEVIDNKIIEVNVKINAEKAKINSINNDKHDIKLKINEYTVLGKQEKQFYTTFKSGFCPTCNHPIDTHKLDESMERMKGYAAQIKIQEGYLSEKDNEIQDIQKVIDNYNNVDIAALNNDFQQFRTEKLKLYNDYNTQLSSLKTEQIKYQNSLKTINENYDQMIDEYNKKLDDYKDKLDESYIEIGQWNEMNELFTKELRYKLLNQLIPQINKSIRFYINKFEHPFTVEFDQEFKSHIYAYEMSNEISYSSLSTGQKKSLDMAIIFGVLQNIISTVDFNVLFLDELFSNIDANARNNMLAVLRETNPKDRTIFIINHSEMADDNFDHKIRVQLSNKKITDKKLGEILVKSTNYETIF